MQGLVFVPLGVAFPVVFIFDSPVASDDFQELLRAGARGQAAHEISHADTFRRRTFFGALGDSGDSHDALCECYPDGFGFDAEDFYLMLRDASVRFAFLGKKGAAFSSAALAYLWAVFWLPLRLTT